MKIVLDTNVLVRANVKARGPAREVLARIISGNHILVISPFLLREVERALSYPRLQKLWRLTPNDVQEHVQFLEGVSEVVEAAAGESVALDDPNDDPVIYAAVAGNVDVLCTLDRDFFAPGVVTFCSRRGIMILSDLDLLLKLRPPQPSA